MKPIFLIAVLATAFATPIYRTYDDTTVLRPWWVTYNDAHKTLRDDMIVRKPWLMDRTMMKNDDVMDKTYRYRDVDYRILDNDYIVGDDLKVHRDVVLPLEDTKIVDYTTGLRYRDPIRRTVFDDKVVRDVKKINKFGRVEDVVLPLEHKNVIDFDRKYDTIVRDDVLDKTLKYRDLKYNKLNKDYIYGDDVKVVKDDIFRPLNLHVKSDVMDKKYDYLYRPVMDRKIDYLHRPIMHTKMDKKFDYTYRPVVTKKLDTIYRDDLTMDRYGKLHDVVLPLEHKKFVDVDRKYDTIVRDDVMDKMYKHRDLGYKTLDKDYIYGDDLITDKHRPIFGMDKKFDTIYRDDMLHTKKGMFKPIVHKKTLGMDKDLDTIYRDDLSMNKYDTVRDIFVPLDKTVIYDKDMVMDDDVILPLDRRVIYKDTILY